DGARQVSWLPALSLSSAFPRRYPSQWLIGRPLAGHSCGGSRGLKPRSLKSLREPHAFSNATDEGLCRQFGRRGSHGVPEYSVFSKFFKTRRPKKAFFSTEGLIEETFCRISKSRKIAQKKRRGSRPRLKNPAVDISIQPDGHLPIETLD